MIELCWIGFVSDLVPGSVVVAVVASGILVTSFVAFLGRFGNESCPDVTHSPPQPIRPWRHNNNNATAFAKRMDGAETNTILPIPVGVSSSCRG